MKVADMKPNSSSGFPQIKLAILWLVFFVTLLGCWVILTLSKEQIPQAILKLDDSRMKAQLTAVSENADGSVDVLLRLDTKVPKDKALLKNVSLLLTRTPGRVLGSPDDFHAKRQVVTKTDYPLTLMSPYVVNNPAICSGVKNLTFLVVVHSAPDHFQRRRAMRETWANKNLFREIQMRLVFLFGLASDRKTQVFIENESTVHGDIVQGNFKDSYKNLTHKGVLGYRWISEFCNFSKIVIKVDDDVFVNVFYVIDNILPQYGGKPKQILCHVRKEGTSPILHGNTKLKWGVSEDDFRGQKFYPTYCNGYAVFMTPDLVTGMYRAAHLTPFFWVDDVYLFGLLPRKIGGVHWENIVKNFTLNQKLGLESYEAASPSRYVVCTAWQEGVMERLWFAALSKMTPANRALINPSLLRAVDGVLAQSKANEPKSGSSNVVQKSVPRQHLQPSAEQIASKKKT